MSPRITFLLTLAGVLLAGLPLPLLTRSAEAPVSAAPETAASAELAWGTISFTGKPLSIKLRSNGGEWVEIPATQSGTEYEWELPAPDRVEIEALVTWATEEVQAVSLTLEPTGREARTATQWKEEGSSTLHSIFTFQW